MTIPTKEPLFNRDEFDRNLKQLADEYDRHVSNKETGSSTKQQPTDNGTAPKPMGSVHNFTEEEWKRNQGRL